MSRLQKITKYEHYEDKDNYIIPFSMKNLKTFRGLMQTAKFQLWMVRINNRPFVEYIWN